MDLIPIKNYEDYKNYFIKNYDKINEQLNTETNCIKQYPESFIMNGGYCLACSEEVQFSASNIANHVSLDLTKTDKKYYWRETLICSKCRLNSRMRGMLYFINKLKINDSIYLTEQISNLYNYMIQKYKNVVASEYIPQIPFGTKTINGILSQDLTNLTFKDNTFNCIASCDVLEHIPNYKKALKECHRVLKPNGRFIFTIPFLINSKTNIIRAELQNDNSTIYFTPPEYHGDPINNEGCLCYIHFGWEILDDLKQSGFSDATGYIYSNIQNGHFGLQVIFEGIK